METHKNANDAFTKPDEEDGYARTRHNGKNTMPTTLMMIMVWCDEE